MFSKSVRLTKEWYSAMCAKPWKTSFMAWDAEVLMHTVRRAIKSDSKSNHARFPQLAIVALAFAHLILFAETAFAGKRIVVPNDYSTIQGAVDETQDGDTVFVLKGTYRENITMARGIVLQGQETDKTILRGDRTNPVVRAAGDAVLEGFTIKGGGVGIISENTNMIIRRNVIRENAKSGIQILISLPHISSNVIVANEWSGVFCELISYGVRTSVEHNVIGDNGHSGVHLSNNSAVLVQNNVLYRNKQFGVYVSENSKKSRIIYNCLYANRKPYSSYAVIDETNISKDPRYPPNIWQTYAFQAGYDNPLRGLGKGTSTIGIKSRKSGVSVRVDSDGDGIMDSEDKCPDVAEDHDGFEDEDGCPDYDNDFDGMYDQHDECPDEAEDFDGFEDHDGCPDPDNDNDGIPDKDDKCPNKAEVINGYRDEDGCPDRKP